MIFAFVFFLNFVLCGQEQCVLNYQPPPVCSHVVYPLDPIVARNASDYYEIKAGKMIDQLNKLFVQQKTMNDQCDKYTRYYVCALVFGRCLDSVSRDSARLGYYPCKGICDKVQVHCKPPESFNCIYEKDDKYTYCTDYGMDRNYWVIFLVMGIVICVLCCCTCLWMKIYGEFTKTSELKQELIEKREKITSKSASDGQSEEKKDVMRYEEYSIN